MSSVSIVKSIHLNRTAIVYIRQSTLAQVRFHKESTERQYALREKALNLGWSENLVQVIDEDLGISGAHKSNRQGFQRLVGQVSLGQVGAIFGLEVSRLARSSADLLQLLEICALYDTIVIDEDGFYDLNEFNDRLILGFKGTMSEAELHFLRARLIGGKKNKALKGDLHFPLPVGYCFNSDGSTALDPDEAVQTAVRHIFTSFQASGSAYGVVKFFATNGLQLRPKALPHVLSKDEILSITDQVVNLKHKTILLTTYSSGLRISETLNLRISDIDSKNMLIRVNLGKGNKDRLTVLSHENLNILRLYWKRYKPTNLLFPGLIEGEPMAATGIQHVFKVAKDKVGITKPATVHTLRHSFATHLLEDNADIRTIQILMGHSNISTTSNYIHLSTKHLSSVKSPLDGGDSFA